MSDKLGPYELNQIYTGECSQLMEQLPADSIDLTVTSPPYDGLREYQGYTFDFPAIARQLYRITKPGGVVVWVVADETKNGSESGTSFRQALGFMELGFNLHDTMIYQTDKPPLNDNRYQSAFEFMFVFSKEKPLVFNPIKIPVSHWVKERRRYRHTKTYNKKSNNTADKKTVHLKSERVKDNVWHIKTGFSQTASDNLARLHPAPFPEALARDHILSWSNPGDLVLDPMAGSGTVAKMAHLTGRNFLSFEISPEYTDLARRRVEMAMSQPALFNPYQSAAKPQPIQLDLLETEA